jgi:hypothetical protein
MGPCFGKPVRIEGDIVQIDRRGSYRSAYVQFKGIPKGRPFKIERLEHEQRDYFYIWVHVWRFEFRSEFPEAFPVLKRTGFHYLDKQLFDYINEHYEWDFDFVSGVGFLGGFNTKIGEVAQKMWAIRMQLKSDQCPLQGVVKRMINTLWGKSMSKDCYVYTREILGDRLMQTLKFNKRYVLGFKRIPDTELYRVHFVKPICVSFTRPQFGINILSWSCVSMHNLIDKIFLQRVFYSNTDCLVMTRDDAMALNSLFENKLIGTALGQMDFEFQEKARKFICISPRKYIFCFENGQFKVRFGPKEGNPEEYFERKYSELVEK